MIKQSAIAVFLFSATSLFGQKVGYVDSDVILKKMPEYKSAQKKLDDLAASWQSVANMMQSELDQLYKDYKAEEVLLTAEQKKTREDAIVSKESELFKYREDKFGQSGALFKERETLIKPIQDKLYDAIQKVAKKEALAFIFDKNGGVLMLYADPKYDKTFEVMEELGIPTEPVPDPK